MKIIDRPAYGILSIVALALAVLTLSGIEPAVAATVIHYDGDETDYVNETRLNLHGGFVLPSPVTNGLVRTWEYSDTVPITPPSPAYTGPALYAALQMTGVSATTNFNPNSGILTGPLTPGHSSFALVSGAVGGAFTALVFLKPNVESGQTVSFDSTSSISLKGMGVADNRWTDESIRFVVQNGGRWYISAAPTFASGFVWSLSDAGSARFALFDPTGAVLPEIPGSGYDHEGASFKNITAVGFYAASLTRANNAVYFTLKDFTVESTVTAIPEADAGAGATIENFWIGSRRMALKQGWE